MAWTDEKKAAVIEAYTQTMENEYDNDEARYAANTDVLGELAEEHEESVNGVRIILSKAKVYVTKPKTAKAAGTSGGTKRVNKAEAIQSLKNLISGVDAELVNDEILDKLTGKAAQYFSGVLLAVTGE